MMRDVPFNMIYFTLYHHWKKNFGPHPASYEVLMCSFGAGAIAAFIDTPADCLKTRLQNGRVQYTGILDCLNQTIEREGVSALFKGIKKTIY